jgi:hypothetical protein
MESGQSEPDVGKQKALWTHICSKWRQEVRRLPLALLEEIRTMSLTTPNSSLMIIILGRVLVIGVALWMHVKYVQKKRTQKLRSEFGPKCDRPIVEHLDRGRSESEPQKRATCVAEFDIHPLKAEERSRYTDDWRREKSLFVDDPQTPVNRAETLVQDVVQRRGYPVGDFDQNATDLSVGHPPVMEHSRIAHEIAVRKGHNRMGTEDSRKAWMSYGVSLEDLLDQTIEKTVEITK